MQVPATDIGRAFDGFDDAVAHHDANARLELGHAEGLGDVVIGPAVEGRDLAILFARGRKDDDRYVAPFADSPTDREPVDVGQSYVEHDHVGSEQRGLGESLFAGLDRGDLVALGLESEAQRA